MRGPHVIVRLFNFFNEFLRGPGVVRRATFARRRPPSRSLRADSRNAVRSAHLLTLLLVLVKHAE